MRTNTQTQKAGVKKKMDKKKEKKKLMRDLRGCMTCCGCTHFVNRHRDKVGCFGDEMLGIWSEAIQGQVNKNGVSN